MAIHKPQKYDGYVVTELTTGRNLAPSVPARNETITEACKQFTKYGKDKVLSLMEIQRVDPPINTELLKFYLT
jgi:hypothetical protein